MDSWSSSSTSSDEEVFEIFRVFAQPIPRVIRIQHDPFEIYEDNEFHLRYRLTKTTVMQLLHLIGPQLEYLNERNRPISAIKQILTTLRYFATGTFQNVIGADMNISKSTVCRTVKRVVETIAALGDSFIHMPCTSEEMEEVKLKFHAIHKFPNVIGCVGVIHIKIPSPGGDNADLYRNSNGNFTYNVQVICDAELKIRDIVARWPGSTENSVVFNASLINLRFQKGEFPDSFLLGDNAYQQKSYFLVPVLNPQTDQEKQYNLAHASTRNVIVKMFEVLKKRFPTIAIGMRTARSTTLATVVAMAVLHNMAVEENEEVPVSDVEIEEEEIQGGNFDGVESEVERNAFIEKYF